MIHHYLQFSSLTAHLITPLKGSKVFSDFLIRYCNFLLSILTCKFCILMNYACVNTVVPSASLIVPLKLIRIPVSFRARSYLTFDPLTLASRPLLLPELELARLYNFEEQLAEGTRA